MEAITISHLIAYYGICLIIWFIVCERLPFDKVIHASVTALFFMSLPFIILSIAQGA